MAWANQRHYQSDTVVQCSVLHKEPSSVRMSNYLPTFRVEFWNASIRYNSVGRSAYSNHSKGFYKNIIDQHQMYAHHVHYIASISNLINVTNMMQNSRHKLSLACHSWCPYSANMFSIN